MNTSRWYEFTVEGLDSSFFIQVAVGDDVMKEVNRYVKELYRESDIASKVFQLNSLCEAPACSGCREQQGNQLAHVEKGGCLYASSQNSQASDKSSSSSHQPQKRARSGTASNPHSVVE